ncbi:glutaredoxin [Candidatus Gracilibacteria bacterium CG17_big_fil_post_rev_8_21_14_2_50_48_13]|nr:MAG: glutaredoxin [Candidatus Gracilibacteria bacterium CG17_big_fil_post_rev_8_21_14_2_50_48_13]
MKAIIYTTQYCPYCTRAKSKLGELGLEYTEIDITHDEEKRDELIEITGRTTVPQIFLHIGGCDDLFLADAAGQLKGLLG